MTARITIFSTLGHGSNEEARIRTLFEGFETDLFAYDRSRKFGMFRSLLRRLGRDRPDLAVMEGTGLPGGAALILGRLLFGVPYIVSSGDAVGPWIGTRVRWLGPPFGLYERVLYRLAAGFVGWTPYLVGRAITFGCRRAITAAGWAPFTRTAAEQSADRDRIRRHLGIGGEELVIGIAGAIVWSGRRRYCYGLELVAAAARTTRRDVRFLIIGDGTGRPHLDRLAAGLPAGRVLFTGRLPQEELPAYYAAMDAAALPQSTDAVGSVRYTTKVSEYLSFGLGVLTGPIPMAYDLDSGWAWRVPGGEPWDPTYHAALAKLIDHLSPGELAAKRAAALASVHDGVFDRDRQVARVTAFATELLAARATHRLVSDDKN